MLTGQYLEKRSVPGGIALFATEKAKTVFSDPLFEFALQPGKVLVVGHDEQTGLLGSGQPLCHIGEHSHSIPASKG